MCNLMKKICFALGFMFYFGSMMVAQTPMLKLSGTIEGYIPLKAAYEAEHNVWLEIHEINSGRRLVKKKISGTYQCFLASQGTYQLLFTKEGFTPTALQIPVNVTNSESRVLPVIIFPAIPDNQDFDTLSIVVKNDSLLGMVMPGLPPRLQKREHVLTQYFAQQFTRKLQQAENFYRQGRNEEALNLLHLVYNMNKDNAYVAQRLEQVKSRIIVSNSAYNAYLSLLHAADSLFSLKQMYAAQRLYFEALQMQHHDSYPNKQLSAIELWKQEQKHTTYKRNSQAQSCNVLIDEADAYFSSHLFSIARRLYVRAIEVCPSEQKKKVRVNIARIDAIADNRFRVIQKKKFTLTDYHSQIALADSLFAVEAYDEARDIYNQVHITFPQINYPQQQLLKIHLINTYERYREKQCTELHMQADSLLKNVQGAVKDEIAYWMWAYCNNDKLAFTPVEYDTAHTSPILPVHMSARDDSLLILANKKFHTGQYINALKVYHQMQEYYPQNAFISARIAAIHELMLLQKKEQLFFDELVKQGTYLLWQDDLTGAREKYLIADKRDTTMFSFRQLLGIEQLLLLNQQAEQRQEAWREKIRVADRHFQAGKYEAAAAMYRQAIDEDPTQLYAHEQLKALNKLQINKTKQNMQQKRKHETYKQLIDTADSLLYLKDLTGAHKGYHQAQQWNPDAIYPRRKIEQINALLTQQQAHRKTVDSLISLGHENLRMQQYKQAELILKKGLRKDPGNNKAIALLENVYTALEQQQEQQHYYVLLQEARDKENQRHFHNACLLYEQLTNLFPDSSAIDLSRQRVCQLSESATDIQDRPESLRQQNLSVLLLKADSLYNAGDLQQADLLYHELVAMYPNNANLKQKVANVSQQAKLINLMDLDTITDLAEKKQENVIEQVYLGAFNLPDSQARKVYLRKLANQYPEGITIEHIKVTGRILTRYVIVKSGLANEYWKVQHDWGGVFYFKNGRAISYNVFKLETQPKP